MRLPLMPRSRLIFSATSALHLSEGGMAGIHLRQLGLRQVIADGVRQNEVAIGQSLHQRAGTQAIGAVVGEVGLTDDVQALEWYSSRL